MSSCLMYELLPTAVQRMKYCFPESILQISTHNFSARFPSYNVRLCMDYFVWTIGKTFLFNNQPE